MTLCKLQSCCVRRSTPPACGISRVEKAFGNADLSVLRALVAAGSPRRLPSHEREGQYAKAKLIVWLSVDEANLNLNIGFIPSGINFANIDVPPPNLKESGTPA